MRWKSAKLVFHLLKFKKKKHFYNFKICAWQTPKKRKKTRKKKKVENKSQREIRYKRHQNQIFPKKQKNISLFLSSFSKHLLPLPKITTSNTFINTIPSLTHYPTFLITRSNTLLKQRGGGGKNLAWILFRIIHHLPPRLEETRIHRDKTNPCPDKWRLADTVLKGREFETTINPGQRLINRGPKPLARRAR